MGNFCACINYPGNITADHDLVVEEVTSPTSFDQRSSFDRRTSFDRKTIDEETLKSLGVLNSQRAPRKYQKGTVKISTF